MNKLFKKAVRFSLAAIMVLGMGTTAVFADDETGATGTDPINAPSTDDTTPTPETTPDATPTTEPTRAKTLPTALTVTGLNAGDTVKFYRVIKHSANEATITSGWVAEDDFEAGEGDAALTDQQIWQMIGIDANGDPIEGGGIDSALAGKISAIIAKKNLTPAYTAIAAGTEKDAAVATFPIDDEDKYGLYVAIVVSGDPQYTYNPVFVAASGNTSWTQHLVTSFPSYSDHAMTKKELIAVEKTANDKHTVDTEKEKYDSQSETVNAGDVIEFTVTTKIPQFSTAYEYATYEVADYLTAGLTLDEGTVKVATSPVNATVTDDYTIHPSAHGYTVTFKKAYLQGLKTTADLTITYTAQVTSAAEYSVNGDSNTVIVSFSKDPTYVHVPGKMANPDFDPSKPEDPETNPKYIDNPNYDPSKPETDDPVKAQGLSKLIDKTNHYTFNIDGKLLGGVKEPDPNFVPTEENPEAPSIDWLTTEVVKVAVDENGNEYKVDDASGNEIGTRKLHANQNIGALAGAKFSLLVGDAASETYYKNSILNGTAANIVSDENGRLTVVGQTEPGIRGLDAGTYYLVEEEAPAGYIKNSEPVKIEIIPTYAESEQIIKDGEYTLTAKSKLLKAYSIKINGIETAYYEITSEQENAIAADSENGTTAVSATKGDNITGDSGLITKSPAESSAASWAGKITNVRGTALPETGGIGTKMFYIVGGALAICAGVLLVAKKRVA